MIYQNARNNIVSFDQSVIKHKRRVQAVEGMITRIVDQTVLSVDVWHEAIINILAKDID